MQNRLNFVWVAAGLLFFTVVMGTVGYVLLEDADVVDAFYMTMITISTVGFKEVFDLSPEGKLFTVIIIIMGTGTVAYTATKFMDYFIAGELGRIFGRRKMNKEIGKLKNHYIVCGFGRMGKVICEQLKKGGVPFVVIDMDEHLYEKFNENKYLFICGDATREDVLIDAGILDSRGLVSVVDSDVKNLYITLTAKGMRKDLYVVVKSTDEEAYSKLMWAGADKVVSPYSIGGLSIANSIIKPHVSEFIDLAFGSSDFSVEVEELLVDKNSGVMDKKIMDSGLRKAGLIVIAIKKKHGAFMYNPGPETMLCEGDTLITLGRKEDFESLDVSLKRGGNVVV